MSSKNPTTVLQSALKKLKDLAEPVPVAPPPHADAALHQLVFSYLQWNATAAQARAAMERVLAAVVDYNELRICLPSEILDIIGKRYPKGEERAERLRLTLNDVFNQEHELSLTSLTDMPKRQAKTYLDELDAIPGYVSARVLLLALGGHAVPVDERIESHLVAAGLDSEGHDALSSWLERQIRAADSVDAYLKLEHIAGTGSKPRAATSAKTKSRSKATR